MARPSVHAPGLDLIEQAQVDTSIEPERVAFCDAHDLIAIVNAGSNSESAVTVYRLKDEIAFAVALRDDEDLRPSSLQWKPDGSLLAVNWSDNVCCLYSGENGKLLYELLTRRPLAGDDAGWTLDVNAQDVSSGGLDESEPSPEDGNRPASIIWTAYNDNDKKPNETMKDHEDMTTDDFFNLMNGDQENGTISMSQRSDSAISDLVNAITTMDTTTVLPRLGKIDTPSGMRFSPEGNKFSTQASTDTIFDASTFAPGIFSTLLISDAQGCMTVFVDETIKVGHIQLSSSEQVKGASSTACSSQVILAQHADSQNQYSLNYIDLPLERLGSPLNYVVSLNTRRLQSLMSYITHTIRCIHQEIQTGIKGIPARLMKLLEEDLRSASCDSTTDTATIELQHLALTSNFHPVLLEWLKDIVKETGHKRWDQATSAMYEHIQSYLFKNLLPALQRFVIAASALRGQAKYHQHTGNFDVRVEVLDELIEWADTLGLVAQRTLVVVTEEQGQFRAFSKWLRVMIDVAVAGPGSKSADETEERESPNFDVDLVLRYLRGPLMSSLLQVLAEASPPAGEMGAAVSKGQFFDHPIVRAMSRDSTTACLKQMDDPQGRNRLQARTRDDVDSSRHPSDPINLPLLTCLLRAHTRVAIEEINAWQSQAVPRAPDTVSLDAITTEEEELGTVYDMSVHPSSSSATGERREIVHVLAGPSRQQDSLEVRLLSVARQLNKTIAPRIDIERLNLASVLQRTSASEVDGGRILHAAFLRTPRPQHSAASKPQTLILAQVEDAPHTTLLLLNTDRKSRVLHTWQRTNNSEPFLPSPTHFIVGGRPGKRVVVVFSSLGGPAGGRGGGKGTRWEVLDLEGMEKTTEEGGGVGAEEDDAEMWWK